MGLTNEGAPECFGNEFDQRTVQTANPPKDIWLLGRIFSEALVWSVFGSTGLNEYRQQRKVATDSLPFMKNLLQRLLPRRSKAFHGCTRNARSFAASTDYSP